MPSASRGRAPRRLGQVRQDAADPLVEVEPDGVMDLAAAAGVQRGDVIDQGVGGSGAVAGDQHLAPVPGRDLRDRGPGHRDMVRGGVAPGVPGPQQHRQGFAGVVTPGRQRVMAVAALERAFGLLLVAVRDHDRGVQADHDDLAQVPPGCPGRRDLAVPGGDQVPDVAAGPRPCPADPGQRRRAASGQCPPRRRVGGDQAEQLFLVAQGADLADRRRAVRDRDRQVSDYPAPVMQRREPAPGQRPGQPAGQARPVSEHPRRRRPRMRHDPVPADLDDQPLRPRHRIHVLSAFRCCEHGSSTVPLSQFERHFSHISAILSPTLPVTVNSGGKCWQDTGLSSGR